MELLTYALTAYKLTRFAYRIYLKRPTRRLYRKWYAWKHRPPTPLQTAQAEAQMRVVQSFIDTYWATSTAQNLYGYTIGQLKTLGAASKALNRARKLDRDAYLLIKDDEGTFKRTIDHFSGHLLFIEATLFKMNAEVVTRDLHEERIKITLTPTSDARAQEDELTRITRIAKRKANQAWYSAERAIDRALVYEPENISTLNLAAEIYYHTDWLGSRARKTIKASLERDPNNIDALRLQQEFRIW